MEFGIPKDEGVTLVVCCALLHVRLSDALYVLKAPDGDCFIDIDEHSTYNSIYDPNSSAEIDHLTFS